MALEQSQSLDIYFRDLNINCRNTMTREEEEALLDGWAGKSDFAKKKIRNQLVVRHLRFAASAALKFKGQGLPMEDLVCLGNLGMIEAAKRFDPSRGYRFITFAVWWINRFVRDALKEVNEVLRVPMSVKNTENTLRKLGSEFFQRYERWPSGEELKQVSGDITHEAFLKAVEASQPYLSLDCPIENDGKNKSTYLDFQVSDVPEPGHNLEREDVKKVLDLVWGAINEREREVVQRYYGLGRDEPESLSDIGKAVGLSRERIRQIHCAALKKFRAKLNAIQAVKNRTLDSDFHII